MIDYKTEDFETKLKDYDLVLHSNKDTKILEKSLRILKPGGQLISLVGPPTPEFATANWFALAFKICNETFEFR